MEVTGLIIRTIGALAMILGLILVMLYGLRKWGKRIQGEGLDMIQVLSTRMILPKKYISLVKVPGRILIVGSSEQAMVLLGSLSEDDLVHVPGKEEDHDQRL